MCGCARGRLRPDVLWFGSNYIEATETAAGGFCGPKCCPPPPPPLTSAPGCNVSCPILFTSRYLFALENETYKDNTDTQLRSAPFVDEKKKEGKEKGEKKNNNNTTRTCAGSGKGVFSAACTTGWHRNSLKMVEIKGTSSDFIDIYLPSTSPPKTQKKGKTSSCRVRSHETGTPTTVH